MGRVAPVMVVRSGRAMGVKRLPAQCLVVSNQLR